MLECHVLIGSIQHVGRMRAKSNVLHLKINISSQRCCFKYKMADSLYETRAQGIMVVVSCLADVTRVINKTTTIPYALIKGIGD